jgi:hypothetical protein
MTEAELITNSESVVHASKVPGSASLPIAANGSTMRQAMTA